MQLYSREHLLVEKGDYIGIYFHASKPIVPVKIQTNYSDLGITTKYPRPDDMITLGEPYPGRFYFSVKSKKL